MATFTSVAWETPAPRAAGPMISPKPRAAGPMITLLYSSEKGTMAYKMSRTDLLSHGLYRFLDQYYHDGKHHVATLSCEDRILNSLRDSDFNQLKDYDVLRVTVTDFKL